MGGLTTTERAGVTAMLNRRRSAWATQEALETLSSALPASLSDPDADPSPFTDQELLYVALLGWINDVDARASSRGEFAASVRDLAGQIATASVFPFDDDRTRVELHAMLQETLDLMTLNRPEGVTPMTEKALLSGAAILALQDIPTESVHVPEWNSDVRVRALTAAERDAFEQHCHDTKFANVRAALVALSLVDDQGARLFSLHDVEALGKKSAAAMDRLFDVASRLSGIGQRQVQALEKNSEADRNGSSSSGSPSVSAGR